MRCCRNQRMCAWKWSTYGQLQYQPSLSPDAWCTLWFPVWTGFTWFELHNYKSVFECAHKISVDNQTFSLYVSLHLLRSSSAIPSALVYWSIRYPTVISMSSFDLHLVELSTNVNSKWNQQQQKFTMSLILDLCSHLAEKEIQNSLTLMTFWKYNQYITLIQRHHI